MSQSHMQAFATKWLLYSLLWSFVGSLSNEHRLIFGQSLLDHSLFVDPPTHGKNLIDVFVNVQDGNWIEWSSMVPKMEIESHKVCLFMFYLCSVYLSICRIKHVIIHII